MAKRKTWSYHVAFSYVSKDGKKVSVVTQLYEIGVYGIINGDAGQQFTCTPKHMKVLERNLSKFEARGEIKELTWGRLITVCKNKEGMYEEIE